jgi:putative transposase
MESIISEFSYHKRHLPHWQQGGYTYFITFRSIRGILPKDALEKVKEHILFGHSKQYELLFGVIMPDHVHLLLRPIEKDDGSWISLSKIMKSLKGSSARSINKLLSTSGSVWQSESFDRMVRDEKELHEKWEYMWNNPIKAGLADGFNPYPFYVSPDAFES